jgi:sugar phosphate isomerase/epimerase|uniref:sugar phosphate isomerase/epimerase family protein n=1 Tax=Cephaloticoccus sp. TaxID=1985742 RepID=UPI00404A06C7
MKIGLDTFSFHIALAAGRYDVFRTLDWMAEHGFTGIQININGPDGRFLGADPANTSHVEHVRRRLADLNFFAEVGGGHATDASLITHQLELAAAVGADVLRTVIGFQGSIGETIAQTRAAMDQVLPFARKLGVRIAIENHEDVTAAELGQLIKVIDDPIVGACLDTGNDLVVYGDPLMAAQVLAPVAISTHIKDQKLIRVGATIYSVGVPLGTGDVELPSILKVIQTQSTVGRVLIQNCTGYSAPLNKFKRPDLQPVGNYTQIPNYATVADARSSGYLLNLDRLTPEELSSYAIRQEGDLQQDLSTIRSLMS